MISFGIDKIAGQVATAPGGWTIVVVQPDQVASTVDDLVFHLELLLEGEAQVSSGRLVDLSCGPHRPLDVAVIVVDALDTAALEATNLARGRLLGGPRVLVVTDAEGVHAFRTCAPDLWSWVGPRVRQVDPTAGVMDVKARLASLRAARGLTDEDVVRQAEAGTLGGDPILAEWLVLLGRGDLLGD